MFDQPTYQNPNRVINRVKIVLVYYIFFIYINPFKSYGCLWDLLQLCILCPLGLMGSLVQKLKAEIFDSVSYSIKAFANYN